MSQHDHPNYIELNKQTWNTKTHAHYDSEFYDNENFIKGKTSLKEPELDLLPDLKGKSVLHLQCHFGQDTISLARMGAKATGVDLSNDAVEKARELANLTNADCEFVCCDIYDLPNHLDKQFDIVFTSYGTIIWLPDLDKWASIVSRFLKPGGQFVFVEFHPVVWMMDDDQEKVHYSYFNDGPIEETETGTYADRDADITQTYVTWNHHFGEVLESLLGQGLQLTSFKEYDWAPYDFVRRTKEYEPGKYRIEHLENKIPLVYSLTANKPL